MGIVDGELPGAGRGGGVTGPTCNISGLGHTVKTGADQKQKQTVHVSSGNETAKSASEAQKCQPEWGPSDFEFVPSREQTGAGGQLASDSMILEAELLSVDVTPRKDLEASVVDCVAKTSPMRPAQELHPSRRRCLTWAGTQHGGRG